MSDALVMSGRSLRLGRRNLDALLTSLLLPIMLMLLFVYLFGGAIHTGTRYVTYVVPGVLLLCAGYGSSLTAVSVSHDMSGGIVDRFRSLDVGGAAFLIGFRPRAGAAAWLAAAGILLLFILAVSWLSAAVGLLARSPEAAGGFTFFVMFLPYPSSAFVPVQTMPGWIHGFADNQPITPVIESLRALLLGLPVGGSAWRAVAWCTAILAVSVALSGVLFRRRVR